MRLYYKICSGSGVDKFQVQAWNLVPGISKVVWGWQKWLLESRIGWKLINKSLWVLWDVTLKIVKAHHDYPIVSHPG